MTQSASSPLSGPPLPGLITPAAASAAGLSRRDWPRARDVLELAKPITWFPPMWAFLCGTVSATGGSTMRWPLVLAGVMLAGPLVCATSQMVNDWFDRFVDAINEPARPIPSGRIPGRWGLWLACLGSVISLAVGWLIGPWVGLATIAGLAAAWGYSAPPLRFKSDGWLGPAVCGLSYEGLSWFTGATAMAGQPPRAAVLVVLVLYSLGAHGIMTLNDFKAVEGDRATGLRSLPVRFGVRVAAQIACVGMALPQIVVIALLLRWHLWPSAVVVTAMLAGQVALYPRLLRDPAAQAPRAGAGAVGLYVLGMLASAGGLGGHW